MEEEKQQGKKEKSTLEQRECALLRGCELWDVHWYLSRHPSVPAEKAEEYFLRSGWKKNDDPSPRFDTELYLGVYPDVKEKQICPLIHFIERGFQENRRVLLDAFYILLVQDEALFSPTYYREVSGLATDDEKVLLRHYLIEGWGKGLDPSPVFRSAFYRRQYPQNQMCPVVHYALYGQFEGALIYPEEERDLALIRQTGTFDEAFYKKQIGGAIDALSPEYALRHFLGRGIFSRVKAVPDSCFEQAYCCAVLPQAARQPVPPVVYLLRQCFEENQLPPPEVQERCLAFEDGRKWITPLMRHLQDVTLPEEYDAETTRLIVYQEPQIYDFGGGIMAIAHFAENAETLPEVQGARTILVTLPNKEITFFEYHNFDCKKHVYRFSQLRQHFHSLEWLCLHIPDLYIPAFLENLEEEDRRWLRGIRTLQINAMNMNNELMPPPEKVEKLRMLSKNLTQTVAHEKYSTLQQERQYGMPVHMQWAVDGNCGSRTGYTEKRDLLIYSPDPHPWKQRILEKIQSEFPTLSMVEINHMPYRTFEKLAGECRWAITFGEGADAYFSTPLLKGGIAFAVYNPAFCTENYLGADTVFSSYEEMLEKIVPRMHALENPRRYNRTSQRTCKRLGYQKISRQYWEQLKNYYRGEYRR